MVRTRVSSSIALLASLVLTRAAAAQAHLEGPASVVGDGKTPTIVTLRGAAAPTKSIPALDVDAGTVGPGRVTPEGVQYDYLPPNIAVPRQVRVSAVGGGRVAPITIALSVAPRPTLEQRTAGPLALAGPVALVIGQDRFATFTVQARTAPVVAVNVGTLEAPVADGPGRWRLKYVPPTARFPQVVVLAAREGDGPLEWLVVRLEGTGRVESRSKPLTRITLRLDAQRFGPFRTDATGLATTPVIAPPGVRSGTTEATDSLGNTNETPFDLGTPRFSRLLAVCVAETVHLLVSNERGLPSEVDEKLGLRLANGLLLVATRAGPGHHTARWQPQGSDELMQVQAALAGEPVSQSSCTLRAAPAEPIGLALAADRARFVSGSGPLVVTARLRYAGPRGGRVVPIQLTSSDGLIEMIAGASDSGVTQVRWALPDRLGGRSQATIRARTAGAPALAAELVVPMDAGPTASVRLDGAPGSLVADGVSRARLVVRLEDAAGNPVRAAGLVARAHDTELPIALEGDRPIVDYRAPELERPHVDLVRVRDPQTGTSGEIALTLRAPPRPFGLGVRLGYLTNFGKLSAPLVGLDADWHPRWLRRRLAIGIGLGVYHATYGSDTTAALTITGVPLLVRVGFAQPLGRFAVSVGIGGGALIARVGVASTSGGDAASTITLGAFDARVGADAALGPGRLGLEVGYLYAPRAQAAISGNFGGLTITAGYRVGL